MQELVYQEEITGQDEKPKILLVDDKQENIMALEQLLESVDAEVYHANSGNAALSLMLRHKFALVLADVQMPEMDGFELVELMRENPDTVYIPVIFITAINLEQEHVYQGYDVGAVDYLFKPIDKHVLLAKVTVFLKLYTQIRDLEKAIYYYKRFVKSCEKYDTDSKHPLSEETVFDEEVIPKILVVDDREENLFSMETLLKKLPVEIIKASSGKAALDLVEKVDFCLILLDVQMPGMDGFEVAVKIREMKSKKLVPIIFVTAISKEESHVFHGYEVGAVDYIFKPVNPDILLSKVIVFTQLAKHRVQLQQLLQEKSALLYKIKKQNVQLGYLAYHDPLTMCANRAGFEQTLDRTLENATRYNRQFALLLIDLDHFKMINDAYGHDYGDEILREVTKRMQSIVRETDYVARIGGDEFAIILNEIKSFHGAGVVAFHITEKLKETFSIKNKELRIGLSIGIACFPNDEMSQKVCNAKDLVKFADVAMFRSKQKANVYEYYTSDFSEQHQERLIIENSLKFAVERNELYLMYQPKIDMETKKIIGVEALVRWRHPEKGLIPPYQFIPIAEETQMVVPIGKWVIHEALKQLKIWEKSFNHSLKMAINISAYQLVDQNFLDSVIPIITKLDIDPGLIELELTETAVMEDLNEIAGMLNELHDFGFIISVDDFGTGYSMLSYLKKLPVHSLKIDCEFVRDIESNEGSAMIVKAIINLAKNFDLSVIAEGVETKEQEKFLLKNGCKYSQGYLYSAPLLPEALVDFVRENLSF